VRLAGQCVDEWCVMQLGQTKGWVSTQHIGIYEYAGSTPPSTTSGGAGAAYAGSKIEGDEKAQPRRTGSGAGIVRYHAGAEQARQAASAAHCVVGVDRRDTLRMRSGPGVDHAEIGEIPPGACRIRQTGDCRGVWCRIAWRGQSGWVNTHYLD
jgi:SH3-like domain-containing protein